MTLTRSLPRDQSQVRAVALEKTRLWAVPVKVIHNWYERDGIFRNFVLTTLDHTTFQHTYRQTADLAIKRQDRGA